MYASASTDFRARTKRGKQHYYKERKQIRNPNIFNTMNILTLLSADAKSAMLLRFPSLTKVEVLNFLLLHFPRWFCLVNGQLAVSATCEKVGNISDISNVSDSSRFNKGQFYLKYYFLHHRNHHHTRNLIFHQNANTITVLYIYSTWRIVPKPS